MNIFLALIFAATAFAESHPSWWTLAEPDATAIVGIHLENLQSTPFGEAIRSELSSTGTLGFPDIPLISGSKQLLISSPAVLAIAVGNFPPDVLRAQCAAKSMKPAFYHGVNLWISSGKTTLSVAQISDQLILIGLHKTLEDAVDRSLAETGRRYSPLLARAARIAPGKDLWIVASQLPDPLAGIFVPLEVETQAFEGSASFRDGVDLTASLDAGSDKSAISIANSLAQSIPNLPAIARSLQVAAEGHAVTLTLQVTSEQLTAALHPVVTTAVAAPTPPPVEPVKPEPEPEGPQVIRIFGLDNGVREIVLKPKNP